MDTSKEYIKMCEYAHEIQLKWEPRQGDFASGLREGFTLDHLPKDDGRPLSWLPRIDQLIELLKESHTLGAILQGIYWFWEPEHFCPNSDDEVVTCKCAEIGKTRRENFKTIEQITLAFVMDELYKKRWNGSKWKLRIHGQLARQLIYW